MNPMVLEWALLVVIGVHILLAVSCRYDLKYDQLLKVRTVIFFPSPAVVDVCSSNCPRKQLLFLKQLLVHTMI